MTNLILTMFLRTICLLRWTLYSIAKNHHRIASLCVSTLLFAIANQTQALSLAFGVYTTDSPTTVAKQFRPTLNAIEVRLAGLLNEPVTIKLQITSSYEQGVKDLVSGKVDFSRLGPASYVAAKQANAQISILAIESKKGQKRFQGVICVKRDSEIITLSDLRGKSFAFGNERSTIGRYLVQYQLMQDGIYAANLESYHYLGRHDLVGLAVAAGQYDAGALKESTFKRLVEQGSRLRVLTTFENVTKPWVASHLLDSKFKEQLKQALLTLDDKDALHALKKDGFLPGKDDDYRMIRLAIENNPKFAGDSLSF